MATCDQFSIFWTIRSWFYIPYGILVSLLWPFFNFSEFNNFQFQRVRHSEALEQGSYRGKSADFLFMYIFGGSMLLVRILIAVIEY